MCGQNGSILLSVKDAGPGLSQQKLKECLQPFMQENMGYARSAEGLGLGLPIAKAICEAHGGELAIQTAPGPGLAGGHRSPTLPPCSMGRPTPCLKMPWARFAGFLG